MVPMMVGDVKEHLEFLEDTHFGKKWRKNIQLEIG